MSYPAIVRPVTRSVDAEMDAQDRKWGLQTHEDGTDERYKLHADLARDKCDREHKAGRGTWEHILTEEYFEALSEVDPESLEKELIQVAAVAANWARDVRAKMRKAVACSCQTWAGLEPSFWETPYGHHVDCDGEGQRGATPLPAKSSRDSDVPVSSFTKPPLTVDQALWLREAPDVTLGDLKAFYLHALGVRSAVQVIDDGVQLMRAVGVWSDTNHQALEGGKAVLDDIFHHEGTPQSMTKPKLRA